MAELELAQVFAAKAEESMAGAESEFVNGRHNNTASPLALANAVFGDENRRSDPSF